MQFDDFEEQQEQTPLQSAMLRVRYPFVGTAQPARLDDSGITQRLAPAVKSVQPPMRVGSGPQSQNLETGQRPDVPKMGIGHRILALANPSENSLETQLQSGYGQGMVPVAKQKIGHRILALGEQRDRTLPGATPMGVGAGFNAGFQQPERNQGFFANFVPRGAAPSAGHNSFSSPGTGVNHLPSAYLPFGRTNAFMGLSGFSGNAVPFGQNHLNPVRLGSNLKEVGQGQIQTRSQIAPKQESKTPPLSAQKNAAHPKPQHKQPPPPVTPIPPPSPSDIQAYIRQQALAYGIPEAVALGLVNKESHFDANARGSLQEVGLFQILPPKKGKTLVAEDANGKKFTIDINRAASDWQYNVRAGMGLLRRAYRQAQASTPNDVIAATYAHYNGGDKNWTYYTRKNAPVHYHIYGQWIRRHGKPEYVEGYMDFYHKWGGK